jgi:uncharacterized membrane protein YgaE (UPF0421/DUF939 family)
LIWALIIAVVFIKPAKIVEEHHSQIEDKRACVEWTVKCLVFNSQNMIKFDCFDIQKQCLEVKRRIRLNK